MKLKINDKDLEVIIIRKKSNKNTYIRVKEDLNIYITTNYFNTDKYLLRLINDNKDNILKMYLHQQKKNNNKEKFIYLGKKYKIVYINTDDIKLGEEYVFMNKNYNLDKWLLKQAQVIFLQELNNVYQIFPIKIPNPSLTIRKMKSRWGVCNIKTKKITLNLELIKKDIKYLDYVIVHELSHLVYPNHQKDFWLLVSKLVPNYKKLRKELNSYE